MRSFFTVALCLLAVVLLFAGSIRSVNISDFQINEENYPTIFDHQTVSMADDGNGNYVTTWVDYRATHPRYYAQLFNWYGTPIGENLLIFDDPVGPQPVSVSRRSNGDFVVAYVHGDGVWAKMYNATGAPVGSPIFVEKLLWDSCSYCLKGPFVSMNEAGHILVGWVRNIPTLTVYGRWLDFNGTFVGDRFVLFAKDSWDEVPAMQVVVTPDDHAAVTMLSSYVLQARFLEYGAAPVTPPDTIAVTTGVFGQGVRGQPYGAVVCKLADGSLCLGWKIWYDSTLQVSEGGYAMYNYWGHDFIRRYSSSGIALGEAFGLQPESDRDYKWNGFSMSAEGSGFTVSDYGTGDDSTIVVQRYAVDGTPQGTPRHIVPQHNRQYDAGMLQVTTSSGMIGFVWKAPGLVYNNDIFRQHFSATGASLGSAQRVHDDFGANQTNPRIVTGSDGTSLSLWIDYRNSANGDLYGQRYDRTGHKIGANFKLNDSGNVSYFTVGGNGLDRAVVAWFCTRTAFSNDLIMARVLDGPALNMTSSAFLVEPATPAVTQFGGSIGVAADGRFVLAYHFEASDSPGRKVFIRKYSADLPPAPLTEKIQIGTVTGCSQPAIAMKPNGEFALTWLRNFPAKPAFQRFTADCTPIDTAVTIVGNGPCASQNSTSMAVNGRSEYAVGWSTGGCNPGAGSWVAMFDALGHQTLSWTRLTDGSWNQFAHRIDVAALPDNNFLAFYQDLACCDSSLWAQRLNLTGAIGSRLRINSDATETAKQNPTLAVIDSTVLFAWEDYRNGRGNTDIFARYLDLVGVAGDVDGSGDIDISDLTLLVDYLFLLLQMPPNYWQADMNGDGVVDVGDVTTMVDFLF